MITFTKEQLIASAHARIEFAEMMLNGELEPLKERTWSIELELARIALASLEAKTVVPTVLRRAPYWARAKSADPSQCYIAGWNACRAAMLQAEPVSQTYKLQEEQQGVTGCWCHACRPVTMSDMRFVVCPDCGNKRCPKANNHRNSCTGSNEPGQAESAYQEAPQPEAKRS